MGAIFSGIVINKNFASDRNTLFHLLQINRYMLIGQRSFDDELAYNLHIDDDTISIGFFKHGTLILAGPDLITNEVLVKKASPEKEILTFYHNDNTNTYCFGLYVNGKKIREKWTALTDKSIHAAENFGKQLPEEKGQDDSEVIFKLISRVLGMDFYDIKEEAPMFRYHIK